MRLLWQFLTKLILLTSLTSSCAGIPAGKIELKNYSEVKKSMIESVDVSYIPSKLEMVEVKNKVYVSGCEKDKCFSETKINSRLVQTDDSVFTQKLEDNFSKKILQKTRSKNLSKDGNLYGCRAIIKGDVSYNYSPLCFINQYISAFTLTIIPYYCQHIYEARATLIYYPEESAIYGNVIKPSLNQAKLGDIFIDENNRPAKLLKTYELKDKVHEVWSLIWMLSWLAVEPNEYSSIQNKYLEVGRHPEVAKTETENNISEALTRSIINDAIDHPQCYKNSDPNNVLKVQSDAKKYQKNYKEILDRKNKETKKWQNQ